MSGPTVGGGSDDPHVAPVGLGLLLVLATAVVSGVSTFVNAYAVQGTNSDAFVTVRNATVALALVPAAALVLRHRTLALGPREWGLLAGVGVVGGAIPFLLFFRGIEMATAAGGAATASFGYRALFLIASVFAVAVLRERLHRQWWVAAALLLAGNALLLALTAPLLTDGTAWVFAATGLWAVEYTISKRLLAGIPAAVVALGRMGIGASALVGYLAVTGQVVQVGSFTAGEWSWVGISALLLLAFVLGWYGGLARVDLNVATSALVLGFPITWVLTVLLRGAPLAAPAAFGAALVAGGVLTVVGATGLRATGTFVRSALRLRAS